MAQLPLPKVSDSGLSTILGRWKSVIDPVLALPMSQSSLLTGISLLTGTNVINHKLGRVMQGWAIVDINAPAQIYRSAALNNKTLTLTSDADVTVSIEVF